MLPSKALQRGFRNAPFSRNSSQTPDRCTVVREWIAKTEMTFEPQNVQEVLLRS